LASTSFCLPFTIRISLAIMANVCEYQAQRLVACEHHEISDESDKAENVELYDDRFRLGTYVAIIIRPYQHSACHT
jgi:hypothetical protein